VCPEIGFISLSGGGFSYLDDQVMIGYHLVMGLSIFQIVLFLHIKCCHDGALSKYTFSLILYKTFHTRWKYPTDMATY
jgi:hypothetical protein